MNDLLFQRNVETYLPLYTTIHFWNKRKARVELPLFPSYVFVRIDLRERLRVLQLPGVVHLVSRAGHPVPLDESEIDLLRSALQKRPAEPCDYLGIGRRVRITSGPLAGLRGEVVRWKNGSRVIVSIDTINRAVAFDIDPAELELAEERSDRPCACP